MLNLMNFISECYVDTNMVKTLLDADKINHQHSCNNVANIFKSKLLNDFAVGIIDDDKKKPSVLNDFYLIGSNNHIKLLKHNNRPHYLIIISKAAEDFILQCAVESNTNLSEYGIPSNLIDLKKITKNNIADKENSLRKLFKILENKNCGMKILKTILNYLYENKFKSKDEDLKQMFSE